MKEMPAAEFKAKCLAIMDEVQRTREPVQITKHGRPVARLIPVPNSADDIFGYMRGKAKTLGNIVGPVIPLDEWETD